MGTVKLRNINKSYGTMQALSDVSLDIEEGLFVVFVGPSGCGKSTLLRTIAGLENISSGEIFIAERDVTDVAPAERGVSMVFQSYALYPHMTVRQNMEFGMKVNKVAPDERAKRVCEGARILQLNDYLDRKPSELSGGQRQRVAIGRAIVKDPDVFLFDEPLSNLDAKLRMQMRVELQALHRELKATMIYVTHDQVEAMTMADIIVVLNAGRVEQVGSPMELYHRPVSKFVAEFIGSPAMNVFSLDPSMKLQGIALQPSTHFIGCRPEHFEICPGEEATLNATIKVKEQLGGESLLHAAVSCDLNVVISTNGDDQTAVGDTIGLQIPERRLHQFDQDGRRLNT